MLLVTGTPWLLSGGRRLLTALSTAERSAVSTLNASERRSITLPGDAKTIELYDTTLRDGTQGESVSLSLHDKLQITERLDEIGFDYIEGGFAGSNEKDEAYFQHAKTVPPPHHRHRRRRRRRARAPTFTAATLTLRHCPIPTAQPAPRDRLRLWHDAA